MSYAATINFEDDIWQKVQVESNPSKIVNFVLKLFYSGSLIRDPRLNKEEQKDGLLLEERQALESAIAEHEADPTTFSYEEVFGEPQPEV